MCQCIRFKVDYGGRMCILSWGERKSRQLIEINGERKVKAQLPREWRLQIGL